MQPRIQWAKWVNEKEKKQISNQLLLHLSRDTHFDELI